METREDDQATGRRSALRGCGITLAILLGVGGGLAGLLYPAVRAARNAARASQAT